jgi:hypothetical protein
MSATYPALAFLLLMGCPAPKDSGDDTGGTPDDSGGDTSDTGADSGNDSGNDSGGDTSSDTGDTGRDTGGDTSDTGGDTAGDTGEDSGSDTSDTSDTGDTAADTADTGGSTACTDADLLLTAEVRDSAGVSGTSFGPRDVLSMVAVLSNPCATDIVVSLAADCLFTGWSVEDSRGSGTGVGIACRPIATSWTVPAGGTLEESQSWGSLRVDNYVLTVSADVPAGSAALKFSVI